jgi:hypothetical protein
MSALNDFRLAVVNAIAADSTFTSTQVLAVPPGENEALKETVFVRSASSDFEYRSLGPGRANKETISLALTVRTYTEGPDHLDAAETAVTRAEAMASAIEALLETDPSVTSTVAYARLARRSQTPTATQSGWSVQCDLSIEAVNYP